MKVLFVYMGARNLAIEYLSSVLRESGHNTSLVFDHAIFKGGQYLDNYLLSKIFDTSDKIVREILDSKPDLICFSVLTGNYQWAINISNKVKKRAGIPIVFGGIHPTAVPHRVIKNKAVDMVITGEGEHALLELVNNLNDQSSYYKIKNLWFKRNCEVIGNDVRPLIRDLDSLPFPDKSLFNKKSPVFEDEYSIITGRYCPYNCTFCGNSILKKIYKSEGKFFRRRSVENVIDELSAQKGAASSVSFEDDIFTLDKSWLKEFSRLYSRKIGLPFFCNIHPNAMDRERAILLKEANCYTAKMGIQSASEKTRKEVLKRFGTNDKIIKAAMLIKDVGIHLRVDHIFDIPFETEDEQIKAARLYNEIRPEKITPYFLTYLPLTEITELSERVGMISKDDILRIEEGLGKFMFHREDLPSKNSRLFHKYKTLFNGLPLINRHVVDYLIDRRLVRYLPSSNLINTLLMLVNAVLKKDRRAYLYIRYNLDSIISKNKKYLCNSVRLRV